MERGQFTFYRFYWEALMSLPKKDRLTAVEAICSYALDGKEPSLSGTVAAVFYLVRPTLDNGRNKALGRFGKGKNKAEQKDDLIQPVAEQTDNKQEHDSVLIRPAAEANAKQNESKTEAKNPKKEREKEPKREEKEECVSNTPKPLESLDNPLDSNIYNNIYINNNINNNTKQIYPEGFEEFWKLYPRKVGKIDAVKSYLRAIKTTTPAAILGAVRRQLNCQQWKKDGGQFIPHPATWLNQGRWDDEVQETSPAAQSSNVFLRLAAKMEAEEGST